MTILIRSNSDFDNAVKMIKRLGKGILMGKMDLKNAFRILPCYPGHFDLLGIMLDGQYYIDKCMPMGCSTFILIHLILIRK
jgi:hypothetical protein